MFGAVSSLIVCVGLSSLLLRTDGREERLRPSRVRSLGWDAVPASAALNVLLDDDAAVSEHRAGHVGEQGPRVGGGLVGFHVAQRRPLAANDASGGVDLAIEHHSAAGEAGRG